MNKNLKNFTALMQVLLLTTSTSFASGIFDDPDEGSSSRGKRSAAIESSKKGAKAKKTSIKRELAEPELFAIDPPVAKKAAVVEQDWKVLDQKALSKQLKSRTGSRINPDNNADATSCCFSFLEWVKTGKITPAGNEEIDIQGEAKPGVSLITIGDQRYTYHNPAVPQEITFKHSSSLIDEEGIPESKKFILTGPEKKQIEKIFHAIPLKETAEGQYAVGLLSLSFKEGVVEQRNIKEGKIKGCLLNFYIYKMPGDEKPVVLIIDPSDGDIKKLTQFLKGDYCYHANFHIWFEENQDEQLEPLIANFEEDPDDFYGFEDESYARPAKKRGLPDDFDLEHLISSEDNKRERSSVESNSIDARALYALVQDNMNKAIKGDETALAWLIDKAKNQETADICYALGQYYYVEFTKYYNSSPTFKEAEKYLSKAVNLNHSEAAIKLARLYFHRNKDAAALNVLKNSNNETLVLARLDLLPDICLRLIDHLSDKSARLSVERRSKLINKYYQEANELCERLAKTHTIPEEVTQKLNHIKAFFSKHGQKEKSHSTGHSAQPSDIMPLRKRSSATDVVIIEESEEIAPVINEQELSRLIDEKRRLAEENEEQRESASEWLQELATKGNNEAQLALAIYYNTLCRQVAKEPNINADAVDNIDRVARQWLEFAAGNGNEKAISWLKQLKELERKNVVLSPSPEPEPVVEQRVVVIEEPQQIAASAPKKPLPKVRFTLSAQPKSSSISSEDNVPQTMVVSDDPKICLKQAQKLLRKNSYNDGLVLLHKIITEYADKNGQHSFQDRLEFKKKAATLYIESQMRLALNDNDLLASVALLAKIANGNLQDEFDPFKQMDLGRFNQRAKTALSNIYISRVYLNKAGELLKAGQTDDAVAMLRKSVESKSVEATLMLCNHLLSQGDAGQSQAFDLLSSAYLDSNNENEKNTFLVKILQNTPVFQNRISGLTPALWDVNFCIKMGEKLMTRAGMKEKAFAFFSAAADNGSISALFSMFDYYKISGKPSYNEAFTLLMNAFKNIEQFDSKVFCARAQKSLEDLGDLYSKQAQNTQDILEAIACYEASIKMAEHIKSQYSQETVKNKLGRAHFHHAKMILSSPSTLKQAQLAVESLVRSKQYCFLKEANQLLGQHGFIVGNRIFQKDKEKAIEFVTHSANLANGEASYWLGKLFTEDRSGVKDLTKAKQFMNMAVEQKYPQAQNKLDIIEQTILKDKFDQALLLAKNVHVLPDLEKSEEMLRSIMHLKNVAIDEKDVLKYLGIVHDAIGQLKWNQGIDPKAAISSFKKAIEYAGVKKPDGSDRNIALIEKRLELGVRYLNIHPMTEKSLEDSEIQFGYIIDRSKLTKYQADELKVDLSNLYHRAALMYEGKNADKAIYYHKKAAEEGNENSRQKLQELSRK
ncbi:MAG: sel1 repeat family protein [Alphaproteobacteria bacterium]|nr:sel1 repeat family protein [Alphaproteobacteria bacterium]